MAELVKQLFTYKPEYAADPFRLCTTYTYGSDFKFHRNKMDLPFFGNKAEIIF